MFSSKKSEHSKLFFSWTCFNNFCLNFSLTNEYQEAYANAVALYREKDNRKMAKNNIMND